MKHAQTILLGYLLACSGCSSGGGGESDARSDAITSCALACEYVADCIDYNQFSCEAACSQLTVSALDDLYMCLETAACSDSVAVEACIPFSQSPS